MLFLTPAVVDLSTSPTMQTEAESKTITMKIEILGFLDIEQCPLPIEIRDKSLAQTRIFSNFPLMLFNR